MKHKSGVIGFCCYLSFAAASFISGGECLIISVILFAAFAVLCVKYRVVNHEFALRKSGAALFIVSMSVFFLLFVIYSMLFIEPCESLRDSKRTVTAKVLDVSRLGGDTVRLTALGEADGVRVKFSLFSPDADISAGDVITTEVKFTEPVDNTVFAENTYNYARGIFLKASARETPTVIAHESAGARGLLNSASDYLKSVTARYLTGDEGGLIKAMFFGDKSSLTPELSQAMRSCGLSHLMAVSGMHLSLVVNFLVVLLDICGLRNRRKLKFAAVAAMSLILALFFGMTASVRRSALMMIIYYGSLPLKRKNSPIDSVGGAVLIILLSEPYACRDVGLLLSVSATLGLSLSTKLFGFRHGGIAESLASAICASCCTLPVSAVVFGGASTVSPIAAAICYPAFALIMAVMLLFAVTGGLLAEPLLLFAGLTAKAMKLAVTFLAGFKYSFIGFNSTTATYVLIAAAYIAVIAIFLRNRRQTVKALLIALCTLAGIVTADKLLWNDAARVHIYSDGQNGMVTVKTGNGITLLSRGNGKKLSAFALRALKDSCSDKYLLAVVVLNENSGVYSRSFDNLPKDMFSNGENALYNISDEYDVIVKDGVITANVYGVTVALAPAGAGDVCSDITVYSGYKKEYGSDGLYETVFCDKRYDDDLNAYYKSVEIVINKDGDYYLRG